MTQQEVLQILQNNLYKIKRYKKFGDFKYKVHVGEPIVIITTINGKQETTNTAKHGDYILTGAAGEEYVLNVKQFTSRYKDNGDGTCTAVGECYAFPWEGEPFSFIASWGEEMICNTGDMLCSPDSLLSEIYRIELNTFNKTYKLF